MSKVAVTDQRDCTEASRRRETWGILGGLGPLASAEFLRTIYRACDHEQEQNHPRVILLSDPSFPDRTQCITQNDQRLLLTQLADSIDALIALGSTRVLVCCVTIHAVLGALSGPHQSRIRSLVDIVVEALLDSGAPHLMLCTRGCRQAEVFQRHPHWRLAERHIVWPDETSQQLIHDAIYELKRGERTERHASTIIALLKRHGVDRYVAGCTELHLLSEMMAAPSKTLGDLCLDPLTLAAREIALNAAERVQSVPNA